MPAITPFLWFNDKAEEAANFYERVVATKLSETATGRFDTKVGLSWLSCREDL